MKIYKQGTGKKYTPFNHFGMTTEAVFNPELGSKHVNITISTIPKGAGSDDEVHENSDQIFYVMSGIMSVFCEGKLLHTVEKGNAIMIEAGDVHAVMNESDEDLVFYAVTAPPLEKTH